MAGEEAVGCFAQGRAEYRIVRRRTHGLEQRCQTAGGITALLGHGQVAFGKELHLDQQELPGLDGLALVQRVLGQLEPAAGLQLAYPGLAVHAAGPGFVLLDLHAAEPVAALLFLPVVLALVFVTLQRGRGRGGLQGWHHTFTRLAVSEVIDTAPVELAAEQLRTAAPLGDAVLLLGHALGVERDLLRSQGGQGIDAVGEDDAVAVGLVLDVQENAFELAPALDEVGIGLVELGDVGQRCVLAAQVEAVVALGLFVLTEHRLEDGGQGLVLPDAAVATVFEQAEPGREHQLPVVQAAVAAQVTHALDQAMALSLAAIVAEQGEADGLTDEFFRVVLGVLHQHIEGVARGAADALDAVGAQGLQLIGP